MIYLKSKEEIELMRQSGRLVALILSQLNKIITPGVTTLELDQWTEDFIRRHGATPAFKGYRGYPSTICASVNHQVVHTIPSREKLKEGDIISIDVGVKLNGYCGDAAATFPVGIVSSAAIRLMEVTQHCLYKGIEQALAGNRIGDISYAVQAMAEANGFSVVREYTGHGIGRNMHEEPQVPHFGLPHTGPRLREGMVLAIEPMVNSGAYQVEVLSDGWTVITKDRSLSAQFEHTVAITAEGPDILSKL
ncbi:type I methionyl aminopeptidase [bacterium (candidate division B38) B3_B38]|nr:MAG: type I methionyl aminopeptidase [bacterium (candidate division B38) B3_B38]